MRFNLLAALTALIAVPAAGDATGKWQEFFSNSGLSRLQESDWHLLTTNHEMDIGLASEISYYVAWRDGGDVGVFMRYTYSPAVSPAELPAPGPLQTEYVETTITCANSTVRLHRMHLYAPDGRKFGMWFDPDASANASAFGSGSLTGMTARLVC